MLGSMILGLVLVQAAPSAQPPCQTLRFAFPLPPARRDGTEEGVTKTPRSCRSRAAQRPEALRETPSTRLSVHDCTSRMHSAPWLLRGSVGGHLFQGMAVPSLTDKTCAAGQRRPQTKPLLATRQRVIS